MYEIEIPGVGIPKSCDIKCAMLWSCVGMVKHPIGKLCVMP